MRRRLVFLISATANPDGGSTVLRGRQLAQLAADIFTPRGIAVECTTSENVHDAVVILNKNLALSIAPSEIDSLIGRGNYVIIDPLDGAVLPGILERSDAIIAASYLQRLYLRDAYGHKPIHFVSHHVDLRIGKVSPPDDEMKMGYFGEVYNARFADELKTHITFKRTDTGKASDTSWMASLSAFNCHYSVRERQDFDGFKPFTKGFLAAHCGVPILVSSEDEEAKLLLPNRYPYRFEIRSPADAIDAIDTMRDDFGGARWREATEAMSVVRYLSSGSTISAQLDGALSSLLVS
jgi:hypothetical protein